MPVCLVLCLIIALLMDSGAVSSLLLLQAVLWWKTQSARHRTPVQIYL